MPLVISPSPWLIFLDDAGRPVPNGQLALYEAGTSTPVTVYTDSLAAVPHPWPITLYGTGRIPGGLYLLPEVAYKFVLHEPKLATADLTGAILKTQDNVMGHGGKVNVTGSVPDAGQLPDTGEPGDAFISADDGHLWVWDDINGIWVDVGPVQGPPGQTGPMGPKGDTGATGPQGATGATGAQGPQGVPGATGAPGAAGAPGKDGKDGAPGAPGPQGPQGATGPQGPGGEGQIGPQGPPGATGPVGPSGPPGVKGDTGATGAQGPAGIIGPHAPTHAVGGSDPLAVTALAGYPGNATTFLRGDGTFATPPPGLVPPLTQNALSPNVISATTLDGTDNTYIGIAGGGGLGQDRGARVLVSGNEFTTPGTVFLDLGPAGNVVVRDQNNVVKATLTPTGNLTLVGTLTAAGLGTTPLNAANLTGTVADARLSGNVALKNIDNGFVAQTLGSATAIQGANALFYFRANNAPVDLKVWRFVHYGAAAGDIRLEGLTDNLGTITTSFAFNRNGFLNAYLDGTSIASGTVVDARLSANVAMWNRSNQFSVGQYLMYTTPTLYYWDPSVAADQKVWRTFAAGGLFYMDALNDAVTVVQTRYAWDRLGNVSMGGALSAAGATLTGGLTAQTVRLSSPGYPYIVFADTRQAADNQKYRIMVGDDLFSISPLNGAENIAPAPLYMYRSGAVSIFGQPTTGVRRATAQQPIASDTMTTVGFDVLDYDTGGMWNGSGIVVKVAGTYIVTVEVSWQAHSVGARYVRFLGDGGSVIAPVQQMAVQTIQTMQTTSALLKLAANQYVQVQVAQYSGATINITCTFRMAKVS